MSSRSRYPGEGESIGPYRILRRIGGGGMGVVYEAEDRALDRRVALKVIAAHLAEDPTFRARFTQEAKALASLDSAHVVHVYTHGEDDGRLYLVTQLVPDGDLGEMLRNFGAPPLRVALDLMSQVAAGLADAHAAGLVHRDIKPANVLLRRRDNTMQAFLSDFGIARQVDAEHTRTGGTIGTPAYMAPELHTGATASPSTDIYSLGCLLWATVSGKAPYTGTSEYQIVRAHHEQPIPQLAGSTAQIGEVNRILRMAMAKDPAQRYAEAWQLRDVLRRARAIPDGARPAYVAPEPHPFLTAPHRTRAIVATVVTIGVLGAAVALAVSQGDHRPGGSFSGDMPESLESSAGRLPGSSSGPPPSVGPGDLETATGSLREALASRGVMTTAQAQCTAERWIAGAGLREMAEAGFFDSDWKYVDQDREEMPAKIEAAAGSAALACANAR